MRGGIRDHGSAAFLLRSIDTASIYTSFSSKSKVALPAGMLFDIVSYQLIPHVYNKARSIYVWSYNSALVGKEHRGQVAIFPSLGVCEGCLRIRPHLKYWFFFVGIGLFS